MLVGVRPELNRKLVPTLGAVRPQPASSLGQFPTLEGFTTAAESPWMMLQEDLAPTRPDEPSRTDEPAKSKADPFRPSRPPLSPIVINAIQDLLKDDGVVADEVAARMLTARAADPDYSLSKDEVDLLTLRLRQCEAAREPLVSLLEVAVDKTPWVRQSGATASMGVGDTKDPYTRACRAECMLAALILYVDGGEVDFLDEERLEVLRDGATKDAVDSLRDAVAAAGLGRA